MGNRVVGRGWVGGLAFLGLLGGRPAAGQVPRRELGVAVVGVASDPLYGGLGLSGAVRVGNELRAVGTVSVGGAGSRVVARGDAALQAVLDPFGRGGARVFGGAGLSGVTGSRGGGYLLVTAGVETAPRARRGLSVELGIAGGVRLAVAYRFRWATPGRR